MSRRRQASWIHRNSRYLIATIAILGIINTAYITITKLMGGETACPTSGCEQVLSSEYAYIFGLPLSLFGLLAYVAMAAFALAPMAINPDRNKELRAKVDNWTWLLLFAGATAMMVFSGYLMYIMATQFVALYGIASICIYCIVSAIFATTLFLLTLLGRSWEDLGQLFFMGILVSMVVLIGSLGIYADVGNASGNANGGNLQSGLTVTTTSGSSELALARHLKQIGAKMYGAYWCPHCHEQKMMFGQQAWQEVTYVECAPDGANPQPDLCRSKNITGYPTWEINGQMYPGRIPLEDLAKLSGYTGSMDFQNNI